MRKRRGGSYPTADRAAPEERNKMNRNTIEMLQSFADAGTVVNGTAGYVNAGTGAVTGFDGGNTLPPELKA